MNDSAWEDGVLSTCCVCGSRVHMLDPEEMDWICDPCSLEGWSGTRSAWRLSKGDVISLGNETWVVVGEPLIDGKRLDLEVRPAARPNDPSDVHLRVTQRVPIHMDRVADR